MRTPSVKALLAAFRDLTPAQAGLIKRIARAVDSNGIDTRVGAA